MVHEDLQKLLEFLRVQAYQIISLLLEAAIQYHYIVGVFPKKKQSSFFNPLNLLAKLLLNSCYAIRQSSSHCLSWSLDLCRYFSSFCLSEMHVWNRSLHQVFFNLGYHQLPFWLPMLKWPECSSNSLPPDGNLKQFYSLISIQKRYFLRKGLA